MNHFIVKFFLFLVVFLTFSCSTFAQTKEEAGTNVMNAAKQLANIYEDGDFLVVEMYEYIEDKNTLFKLFRSIADADAVINHRARHIFFYDPSKNKIGEADRLYGIRLIEK